MVESVTTLILKHGLGLRILISEKYGSHQVLIVLWLWESIKPLESQFSTY